MNLDDREGFVQGTNQFFAPLIGKTDNLKMVSSYAPLPMATPPGAVAIAKRGFGPVGD
jgi:hypothetical protein